MIKKLLSILILIQAFTPLAGQGLNNFTLAEIPDSLLSNSNVIIRDQHEAQIIDEAFNYEYKISQTVTILNATGKSYAYQRLNYDANTKVTLCQATIYNKHGKVVKKIRGNDVKDYSHWDGFSVALDDRYKLIDASYGEYPYTITFEMGTKSKGYYNLRSWFPLKSSKVAIVSASMTIESPHENAFRDYPYLVENIEKAQTPQKAFYKASVSNVKPRAGFESYFPTIKQVPHIRFVANEFKYDGHHGSFKNWREYSDWNSKLQEGRDILSDELKAKIDQSVPSDADDETKARILYDWLQSNTRYVSIQLGIGGMQTMSAEEVASNGYSDCKGLTNLMKSMLKHTGVKSHYAIIGAGADADDFDPDIPMDYFNHVFLCLPNQGDTIWLECTSQTTPFGYLGYFTSDRWAVLTESDNHPLVRTKAYSSKDNTKNLHAIVYLNSNGDAAVKTNLAFQGTLTENFSDIELLPSDELNKKLHRYFDLNHFDLNSKKFSYKKDIIPQIEIDLDLKAKGLSSTSGKRMFITLNTIDKTPNRAKGISSSRTYDIIQKYAYSVSDTIIYHLPENYALESVPKTIEKNYDFGNFKAETIYDENKHQITYTKSLTVLKSRIPASNAKTWIDFWKSISKYDRKKVVLVQKI
ncbi:transglutaminase domain-containing protein [Aureibacter tunicatorum]|uniref:Transglutaminase-like putative cysteine protease n=1 Tax=Aureibacter tunicatorum TaxID=866807 RepID=A0AAE3XK95_9BACT|nr:transglutaminase domain-containing protein [Aureibacter tunicatorum]MDR6238442.1 transglutaminase-like putative cysteine protease [Aureibacter tunicatorum]BDD05624.1 hypothetical protein AUTU_31070 [Aureibacter tunicatorum]